MTEDLADYLDGLASGQQHRRRAVRAAIMEAGGRRYADWPQVTEWVRAQVGQRLQLTPASAMVWRIAGEAGKGTEGDES